MKKFLVAWFTLVFALIPSTVFAAWYNPLSWGGDIGKLISDGGWGIAAIAVGWLIKRTIDSFTLKSAIISIKDAVDSVRMANDANSPGGAKVTVGEAVGIAEKSLTSILSVLRTLNPAWLPHWVSDTGTTSAPNPTPIPK